MPGAVLSLNHMTAYPEADPNKHKLKKKNGPGDSVFGGGL
ncbi:hypothetical protein CCP2SC5_60001 [Azospirillaceae bacterium]